MTERLIVVGGDAAGMSAASTAKRRLGGDLDVLVFERGPWTSYSACGIPYWLGGFVDGPDRLVARTPQEHRERGIDLRTEAEVVALDPAASRVTVREQDRETSYTYDHLLVATGAEPVRPDLPGIDADGVYGVQTLADGEALLAGLESGPERVVVVGSGYIGLEMAEACMRRGLETVLVDRAETPMRTVDPDLGEQVGEAMAQMGIDVRMSTPITGFDSTPHGTVRAVRTDTEAIEADLVVLGMGVRGRVALAHDGGLPVGSTGAIRVDGRQRVDAAPNVWAAGDCAESYHRMLQRPVHVPLGTHANKQGLVAGANIAAQVRGTSDAPEFPGILGTAVTKVCDLEIARTGLGESEAREAGFDPVATAVETTTKAGYLPDANPMTVKMVADRGSRRVLGAQIVGREGSALRIDTVATALWAGMSVDAVMFSDLAYAPPFSSVWDPVQVAARALVGALGY